MSSGTNSDAEISRFTNLLVDCSFVFEAGQVELDSAERVLARLFLVRCYPPVVKPRNVFNQSISSNND